mmetsp:Transcript_55293/g.131996  ORF Transcript_55293/g.131996 Transcript_55293/m.131996 type:complete len:204 (+) Transcript_55293:192-803(+)
MQARSCARALCLFLRQVGRRDVALLRRFRMAWRRDRFGRLRSVWGVLFLTVAVDGRSSLGAANPAESTQPLPVGTGEDLREGGLQLAQQLLLLVQEHRFLVRGYVHIHHALGSCEGQNHQRPGAGVVLMVGVVDQLHHTLGRVDGPPVHEEELDVAVASASAGRRDQAFRAPGAHLQAQPRAAAQRGVPQHRRGGLVPISSCA